LPAAACGQPQTLLVLWRGLMNHAWRTHSTPTYIGLAPALRTRVPATSGEYHAVSPLVLYCAGRVDDKGHLAGIPLRLPAGPASRPVTMLVGGAMLLHLWLQLWVDTEAQMGTIM